MKTFFLRVVTPYGEAYSGEVEYLRVDTPDGKLGLMSGALPRVIALSAGEICAKTSLYEYNAVSSGGLLSIGNDGAMTVLTEKCVLRDKKDDDPPETDKSDRDSAVREYKMAKAQINSSIKKLKDKGYSSD